MKQVTPPRRGGLRLEGVRNFRDLGGTPVGARRIRAGLLYRSGHFGAASPEDRRALGSRGLRFFDLRRRWEAEIEDPVSDVSPQSAPRTLNGGGEGQDAALWAGIRVGRLEEAAVILTRHRAEEAMLRLYSEDIAGDPAPYARFLASMAEGQLPLVVHCSAGKDRTGWAVVVLLTALGASEAAIEADYLQSSLPGNQYLIRTQAGQTVPIDGSTRELIRPLLEARPAYLASAWASVERTWGSRASYLERGLGITPPVRAALRTRLLDDEPADLDNLTSTPKKATNHVRKL